ncbi:MULTISPECIES: GlxA family transcriptional regulator [unclassified Herbaspirillum]|uniref:GlxA family transcriptional regulator n=1 Tax=unclassified Herbaspirillum TaxID=2624150 RepID=UPI00115331EB|nr:MULTISPECIES: GlxA family transcriptional regulator [unclassified Herbaspirillum]MBB5390615.1 transcriptional regulator GlxA family with amidase domain [Herbaspirillum sp. SJZ102]TQK08898.1 AraC family transcriptional regulator with amidase-like domain [Herbaspirillum sp. SJZ130]TQK14415.1 AraC family transcriptional regulator with amidase-like domain [Herbaspirillum sp. SJZ106]
MTKKSDFLPTPAHRHAARQIVFVAFEGTEPLDLTGPIGVFTRAEEQVPGTYRIRVASVDGAAIRTRSPLMLAGIEPLSGISADIDTLLVAGGHEPAIRRAAIDPALIGWLREHAGRARRIGSICTGAFVLGAAGLLDGRSVTTHWAAVEALQEYFPQARVDADAIYRIDGRLYTSAGVTAGIDLALAMVKADLGHAVAAAIARDLVLFLHRPGGQRQFSATLAGQDAESDLFADLLAWMLEHPQHDLRVAALAERAAMSPRNFARQFQLKVGKTPARYVLEMRLDHACRHLENTAWTIERVAEKSGLKSADTMHRLFREKLGVTPSDYRARFAAGGPAR